MDNEYNMRPEVPAVLEIESVQSQIIKGAISDGDKPFVLRDCVSNWPIVQCANKGFTALKSYLSDLDRGGLTTVLSTTPYVGGQFGYTPDLDALNFHSSQVRLKDFLVQLEKTIPLNKPRGLYLQSMVAKDYVPDFMIYNTMPFAPLGVSPRLWIGNATRAALHNDHDLNLACVVAGKREFLLFPPDEVDNLYIGPLNHTPSGRPITVADIDNPDFVQFPKLKKAFERAQQVLLNPGDVLFVPRYWWHQVTAFGPVNMLVNYWWGQYLNPLENPAVCFNQTMAAFSGLKETERAYWRKMFLRHILDESSSSFDYLPRTERITATRLTKLDREQLTSDLISTLKDYFKSIP